MAYKIIFNAASLNERLSGVGVYTYELIKYLISSSKNEIFIFSGFSVKKINYIEQLNSFQANNKIKKHFSFVSFFAKNVFFKLFFHYIKSIYFNFFVKKYNIDLYHETSYIAFFTGIPTVTTIHDLSWYHSPELHPKNRSQFYNLIIPKSIKKANYIITDSSFVKSEIEELFSIPKRKISSIELGVRSIHANENLKYKLDCEYKYFLYIGTIEPRKKLNNLILSYLRFDESLTKKYKLLIIGARGWNDTRLINLINQNKNKIIYLGYQPDIEIANYLAQAYAFVYLSSYEGFGLPIIEAMSKGIPVICSNHASIDTVAGFGNCLRVDSNKINQIHDAMLFLINNKKQYSRFSKKGLDWSNQSKFSWASVAKKTNKIYGNVIRNNVES